MKRLELWYPVDPFYLNQGFGENVEYYKKAIGTNGHPGLDMRAETGRNIRAAHEGIVTFTGEDGSGGLICVVRTLEPFDYNGATGNGRVYFKSIYCHLKTGSFKVRPNQRVKVGDILAQADNTGLIKSGNSHLHFSIKPILPGEQDWQWYNIENSNGFFGNIDPTPYFNGKTAYEATQIMQFIASLQKVVEDLKKRIASLTEK